MAIPNRSSSSLSDSVMPILSLMERWSVIMPAYAMKTGMVERMVRLKQGCASVDTFVLIAVYPRSSDSMLVYGLIFATIHIYRIYV